MKKITLHPLKFTEAVSDFLKVKPPAKPKPKARQKAARPQ
jgi:hypothetical protein